MNILSTEFEVDTCIDKRLYRSKSYHNLCHRAMPLCGKLWFRVSIFLIFIIMAK